MVNAIVAPAPVIYHWVATSCAGYTKRAFANAAVSGFLCVGNIIGPQTFQASDAREYHSAKISVLTAQAASAVLAAVLFAYYARQNRCWDRLQNSSRVEISDEPAWGGLTDKENKSFR